MSYVSTWLVKLNKSYSWELYTQFLLNPQWSSPLIRFADVFFLVTIMHRVRDQMKNYVMIFLERLLLEFVNR